MAGPVEIAEKEGKWTVIQKLWNEDYSSAFIQERLGLSQKQLSVQLHRMREAGWDVPRRYKPRNPRHGRPRGR